MGNLNAANIVAYKADSSRQKNRNTKAYGSVQCRRTQRRPVKALVELVKSDDTTVGGFNGSFSSIGHRALHLIKVLLRVLRHRFNFTKNRIIPSELFDILFSHP